MSVYRYIGISVYRYIGISVYRYIGISLYRYISIYRYIQRVSGSAPHINTPRQAEGLTQSVLDLPSGYPMYPKGLSQATTATGPGHPHIPFFDH